MGNTIYLAGLPRSGSTLLCNLLAQHPEITSTPSSPLCEIVQNMRRNWSDAPFLLAQLDSNFEEVYDRLGRSTVAFMDEWSRSETSVTVDKNRGWLFVIETLRHLYPDFKMLVTLRDLRDVYASVEKQHRKTLLLDFPDHMEQNLVDLRASTLFADQGMIGSPVKALNNVNDVPDISKHIFYVRFEDLISEPKDSMGKITEWMGLESYKYDFENIEQKTHESDSYYRFKYRHTVEPKLQSPPAAVIAPRILDEITNRFAWYFDSFYATNPKPEVVNETEERIAQEIKEALEE